MKMGYKFYQLLLVIFIAFSCSRKSENEIIDSNTINNNKVLADTIITKAFIVGENWKHGCFLYKPWIIPIKDYDFSFYYFNTYSFGLGFQDISGFPIEKIWHDKSNYKMFNYKKNSFNDVETDSILIAPVVIKIVEKSKIYIRYSDHGNVNQGYEITSKKMFITYPFKREVDFTFDNRDVEIINIVPYKKGKSKLSDYFKI
jgi:hypothetical protein